MSKDSKDKGKGPKRVFTVEMTGFAGIIHALGRLPLDYNRALPLIERGEVEKGADKLKELLVKVEMAKAVLMGNLAFTAMKQGDISSVRGYLDVGYESMKELGLEGSELGKMYAVVLAQLPPDTGDETDGTAADGATPAVTPEGGDGPKTEETGK